MRQSCHLGACRAVERWPDQQPEAIALSGVHCQFGRTVSPQMPGMSPKMAPSADEPSARIRRLFWGTNGMKLQQRLRRLTPAILAWAVLPCAAAAALAGIVPQPSVLWNRSASEPPGLYVRTAAAAHGRTAQARIAGVRRRRL